jgi:hypothetical protein
MLDRLPYYHAGPNIAKLFEIIGEELSAIEEALEAVRNARDIDQATGISLDYIGRNVGVYRRKVKNTDEEGNVTYEEEGDTTFRDWIKWNIFLQESSGLIEEIKAIIAWWLRCYKQIEDLGGTVPDPWMEGEDWEGQQPPQWFVPCPEDVTGDRDVEAKDILVWDNYIPLEEKRGPDDWNLRYRHMLAYFTIEIPWQALPFVRYDNAFIAYNQYDFDDPYDPPEDHSHGADYGIIGAPYEDLDITPINEVLALAKAAGVQAGVYGYGGFMAFDQHNDHEIPDPYNPPEDNLHGASLARCDGDVLDMLQAWEDWGELYWLDER